MQKIFLIIPDNVGFSDLKLSLAPDGSLEFDTEPLNKICSASGIDASNLEDEQVMVLILKWYAMHIKAGGAADAVAEDMLGEVCAEDATGQQAIYPDKVM